MGDDEAEEELGRARWTQLSPCFSSAIKYLQTVILLRFLKKLAEGDLGQCEVVLLSWSQVSAEACLEPLLGRHAIWKERAIVSS